MDYEKKYKDALERARQVHTTNVDENKKSTEYIFPELKESEDEKIRKELIHFLEDVLDLGKDANFNKYCKSDCAGWIAWLEKQGSITILSEEEQNKFAKGVLTSCAISFINYLDAHKYEGKMCVSNGECEDIENAFHNGYYCKYIEKQGEQKPAWSKEDEWKFSDILALLRGGENCHYNTPELFDWLKFIKERYTWKPSDEQMKALKAACDEHWEPDGLDPLYTLWEQLKKLKEE